MKSAGNGQNADAGMISKTFFRLLPIQFLLIAVGSINAIVDSTMADRMIGYHALSVIGLYFPVLKLLEMISTVLQGGAQILCGRYIGRSEMERTSQIFSLDILLSLGISAVVMLAAVFAADPVSRLIGGNYEAPGDLADYLRGIAPSFPAQVVGAQLSGFLQLERQEKRTYAGIAVMAALNAACNFLFISVFRWGLFGLGLATSISTWAFLLIQLSYYMTGRSAIRFRPRKVRFADTAQILRIGLPGAVSALCQVARAVFFNAMLLRYTGSTGLAAYEAANSSGNIFYAATGATASSTPLLSSVYFGEEDRVGILLIMRTALRRGILLVAGIAAALFLLAVPFTYGFTQDPSSEFFRLTLLFFRAFPLSMPLTALCIIYINYYQSANQLMIVNVLSVFDGVAGMVISCLALGPLLSSFGFGLALVLNGVYTALIVLGNDWMTGKKPPRTIEDTLALPADFGLPEENRLDTTLREVGEAVALARKVISFCEGHGVTHKTAVCAGLCVEEMAGNIIQHGFHKDRKAHSVDIRVLYKNDDGLLLIRLKDDCRPFNPKERAALFDPEDPAHNVGIRMAERICRSMEYNFVLGLNVLTMTFQASDAEYRDEKQKRKGKRRRIHGTDSQRHRSVLQCGGLSPGVYRIRSCPVPVPD